MSFEQKLCNSLDFFKKNQSKNNTLMFTILDTSAHCVLNIARCSNLFFSVIRGHLTKHTQHIFPSDVCGTGVGVLFFIKHWPYFLTLQGGAGLKKGISLPRSERGFQSLIRQFRKSTGISWVLSSHLSTVNMVLVMSMGYSSASRLSQSLQILHFFLIYKKIRTINFLSKIQTNKK
jgi:hypothetical protein